MKTVTSEASKINKVDITFSCDKIEDPIIDAIAQRNLNNIKKLLEESNEEGSN